jgi:hypothetical protein
LSIGYRFEFSRTSHDGGEIGLAMLACIAKRTGLNPEDL